MPTKLNPSQTRKSPLSKWQWQWHQLSQQIWPRVTLYALASVAVALIGVFIGPLFPELDSLSFKAESLDAKLSILASSMLAVSTFSLGVMTSAFSSASSGATPRVTQLLLSDKTSQVVLATFLGAFVFSLVGIITLEFGIYGQQGRLILFAATIVVFLIIIATFVRWIHMLRTFGRLSDSISRVETVAIEAFDERINEPYLGCHPLLDHQAIPESASPLFTQTTGYLSHIDFPALEALASDLDARLFLPSSPGRFFFPNDPLLWIETPTNLDPSFTEKNHQLLQHQRSTQFPPRSSLRHGGPFRNRFPRTFSRRQ